MAKYATVCADGINADRHASDYTVEKKEIKSGDTLTVNMAPGSSYLVRFRKKVCGW